jgi:hypothetical protein
LIDESHEILLIARRVHGVAAVLLALPEEEARDLVLCCPGVVLAQIRQHFLCVGSVIVILPFLSSQGGGTVAMPLLLSMTHESGRSL